MSIVRKMRKLVKNPRLFVKDAFENKFGVIGTYQYTIISAVYNVEKYLEDYFNSIINQRLDFKRNIFMILVDDGSTDDSAEIIKKYQKKYPKNIVYLYKENGGQASARNLGLKYMREHDYKTPWVTFTDPDDFLDRNYFYEVDKFLTQHQNEDICMIGVNTQMYFEKDKSIQNHPFFKFKFEKGNKTTLISELKMEIQTSTVTLFLFEKIQKNYLYFDERIDIYEDVKFMLSYCSICLFNEKEIFLKDAKYFIRKRLDGSSTMSSSFYNKKYYLDVLEYGVLKSILLYNHSYSINCALSLLIPQIKLLINAKEKINFLTIAEKDKYLQLVDSIFLKITSDDILSFNVNGNVWFTKVGILNCFKKEKPPFQIAYIEDYDPYQEQILLTYYTGDAKDIESIKIDGQEVYADYEKIVQYDFLDRVFCYEKRFWVRISNEAKDSLEIFINGTKAMIGWQQYSHPIYKIRQCFVKMPNRWLFIDRDIEADDNAEHLYRYIMQNHPEQEMVFALKRESSDWNRLEKEGFNLVECYSEDFFKLAKSVRYFVTSHTPSSFGVSLQRGQYFLFLGHGVDAVDISSYFNMLKINLRFSSCFREYEALVQDYGKYKLTKKEVVLTGQPRHDSLLLKNKEVAKTILIMPTWRFYLAKDRVKKTFDRELKDDFFQSEYFVKWNSFLNNPILKQIVDKFAYKVIFVPHFNMKMMIDKCNFPKYIQIKYRNNNESFQNVFFNSALMITDYTSAAFEMGYLEKPVIYFQFDKEYFFSHHSYSQGWFNYDKDGFGPVVKTEHELLECLEKLLQGNCVPNPKHKKNMENLFCFRDYHCCRRTYEQILELGNYRSKVSFEYVKKKAFEAQNFGLYCLAYERWKYIINQWGELLDEKCYYHFLYCARKSNHSDHSILIVKQNNVLEKLIKKNMIMMEVIKNYLQIDDFSSILKILELFKIKDEYVVDFIRLKLKIYFYNSDFKNFIAMYYILLNDYGINSNEIFLELLMLETALSRSMHSNNNGKQNLQTVLKLEVLKIFKIGIDDEK
ncbi:CDP-glycerol glycerophosphotransferase family protein [Campylobacter jejuni]|uniref:CDP-glycerol glycerophosphotransferase family protein n=3 Tax=Campylobacter jejuni TaxID=197 RepID=UPI002989B7FA|nr:CDP-glycerol glycerophosphotransferase family protein [Campylobacter jejuni]